MELGEMEKEETHSGQEFLCEFFRADIDTAHPF